MSKVEYTRSKRLRLAMPCNIPAKIGETMTCKLCQEDKPLCDSHIISECFYESIYDKKHRILPISLTNHNRLEFEQKGFREELLCSECEGRLSKWESKLKKDFVDIGNESSNFLSIIKVRKDILKVSNIRYDYFKRGILSLVWRLSVSSNPFYNKYKLGLYEDKLRKMLLSDKDIPELAFPIMISKCKLDDKYFPDIIMTFPPGKVDKIVTVQKFIIWGILVSILVDDRDRINGIRTSNLRSSGELFVTETQLTEFAHPKSVIGRLFDQDVELMHKKMQ